LFTNQTTVFKRARKFKWGQNEFLLSKQTQIVLDEDGLVAANFRCSTSQIRDCLFTKQTQQFQPFHIKKTGTQLLLFKPFICSKSSFCEELGYVLS
jgi:hypothetical protein